MPEGDTIFRAASTLARVLTGQTVTRFQTVYAQLDRFDDQAPIAGRTVEKVEAVGKHLLMHFSGGLTLRTHMRMNGSWHIYRPGERWQRPHREMRIVVATDAFEAVAFNVPVAEFLDERALARSPALQRLGPDLLSADFDPAVAVDSLRARGELPLHAALLNQTVLAGLGNVYRSELLFMLGLHPDTLVAALDERQLTDLVALARRLLQANVAGGTSGSITTYTGLRRTTGRADESERLWVYGRRGKPCRKCATPIEYRKVGLDARGLHFCPRCQPVRG